MYSTVPMITPGVVCDSVLAAVPSAGFSWWVLLASPKSSTFTCPSRRQHDIGRLDVPVDNPLAVRFVQRVGHLDANVRISASFDGTLADPRLQRLPLHLFHGNVVLPFGFSDFIDGGNVGVIQAGSGLGLPDEATQPVRIAGHFRGKHLQRHRPVQPGVPAR